MVATYQRGVTRTLDLMFERPDFVGKLCLIDDLTGSVDSNQVVKPSVQINNVLISIMLNA